MKNQRAGALALLMSLSPLTLAASSPRTLPTETYGLMKHGKKLDLLWVAPGFDGSKGCTLGQVTDPSGDRQGVAAAHFPTAVQRVVREGAPYALHIAVTQVLTRASQRGDSSTRVEVEGRVVAQDGTMVAAFDTVGESSIQGNERDNARTAVDRIVFAIAKDLFPVLLHEKEKISAAVIHAGSSSAKTQSEPATQETAIANPPVPVSTPMPVVVPLPALESEVKPQPATPSAPGPEAGKTVQPELASEPVSEPASGPASGPVSGPGPVPPAQVDPALQKPVAEVPIQMKKGKKLDKFWTSPTFDKTKGFALGEIRYQVNERSEAVTRYLPTALSEVAKADAPLVLNLAIVELTVRSQSNRSSLQIVAEGRLVAPDGVVMAAFYTREIVSGTGDSNADGRDAVTKLVQAIRGELF